MPTPPHNSQAARRIQGSVFSSLAHRIGHHEGEVYPLHVGDTFRPPPEEVSMAALSASEFPTLHQYTDPIGSLSLRTAIAQSESNRFDCDLSANNVLIGAGATGTLSALIAATVDPGESVLLVAPYWPIIAGIVQSTGGRTIDVVLPPESAGCDAIGQQLEQHLGPETVAVYYCSPNNPTGRILSREELQTIADFCKRNDLRLIADEVYRDYSYTRPFTSALEIDARHLSVVCSFSKAFGMAGNRCGFLIAGEDEIQQTAKLGTHLYYAAPTPAQVAAERVVRGMADDWLSQTRSEYLEISQAVAATLSVEPPQGGTFLFLDLEEALDEKGLLGLLEDCADRGLFLAPGTSFGDFPSAVRLSLTACEPDLTMRGAMVLAKLLEERGARARG